MSDHTSPAVERHCDVCVVGGSAAGLAAALQLGRQRRSVIVVDDGEPRNASAAHLHGYLGHDGHPASELVTAGREEVRSYGGEVLAGHVRRVTRTDGDRLRVELLGGHAIVARRVLAATGLPYSRNRWYLAVVVGSSPVLGVKPGLTWGATPDRGSCSSGAPGRLLRPASGWTRKIPTGNPAT